LSFTAARVFNGAPTVGADAFPAAIYGAFR